MKKLPEEIIKEIARLYRDEGLGAYRIAKRLGIGSTSVNRYLKKLGIPLRNRSDYHITGRKLSEETKKKISETIKKLYKEGKIKPWNKGLTKETHNKLREISEKISKTLKGYNNPKLSELNKIWNKDPEFRKKQLKGLLKRPTILEKIMINFFKEYNLPFKYVGNGEVIIHGFNPDFIECNGKKMIIEVASSYFHNRNYEKRRKAIFAKYGFKTLVIWDYDIFADKHYRTFKSNWKQDLLIKIKSFIEGEK
jgi:predicted transcriptional regulator/very-short-patch-repair endonuclease